MESFLRNGLGFSTLYNYSRPLISCVHGVKIPTGGDPVTGGVLTPKIQTKLF